MTENGKTGPVGLRIARITALMAGIYIFFHILPDLAPERPETLLRRITGDPAPELCSVDSLGFTKVSEARSPLTMRLSPSSPPKAGKEVQVIVALNRPGGTPVLLDDLEEVHTEKFHLLVVDPSLEDYHHEHPVATGIPGEYKFSFTPQKGGKYRLFADLLPKATGRPIQAVADLEVAGEPEDPLTTVFSEVEVGSYQFAVSNPPEGFRARKPELVSLEIRDREGKPVKLEPVMGAYAHLVAFDEARSGFAHMHPIREGLEYSLDPIAPSLEFIFHADRPGTYAVWAQVKIGGEERFAPFVVEVL